MVHSRYFSVVFSIPFQERNVVSVSVSAGVEEEASKLLCQPKSDVLLLLDVQYGSKQWLDLLLWRTKQAQQSSE